MPQANAVKAKYAVLIKIAVKKGTSEMLKEKYGRKEGGGQENHELTKNLPAAKDQETNIIKMKVEAIKGGGNNINFMITSKSPDNIEEGDPLFDLDNNILSIDVIEGITEI